MKRVFVLGLGSLALAAALGCANAPAGSAPATPQSPYQKAATVMVDFSADVLSAQQVVTSLHAGGAIDDATYKTVQLAFGQIAIYGPQIDALISAQASAVTITAKVNSAVVSLESIVTATGRLDPNTATQIKVAVQALALLLQQVDTTFGNPTAANYLPNNEVNYGSSINRPPGRAVSFARHAGVPADRVAGARGRYTREAALRNPRRSGCELRQNRG